MDLDPLLVEHGLWLVFLGTAISSDSVALTAGVLEQRGVFERWPTIIAIALGGWVSDIVLYLAALLFSTRPSVAKALDHPAADRFVSRFLGRPILLAALFRFVPGSRTFVPLALAAGGTISFQTYAAVTAVTALVWGWLMVAVGHQIGDFIQSIWGTIRETESILVWPALAIAVFLASIAWRVWHVWRKPR
ncbi:membrane protein DedA with SNARE-associated domain [Palleronia aestuarii]|uniref:Membrane protein DedA with SNARE-associated domain n=1 Tax=Palleronia aestuarii TaxID=568105 RepID=A0A2W7N7N4_9RHOB|nr:VTT domain-containing protein [Palleronia aestuarii]PZX16070.1 membrane protein DedA with SNARE-associated domain [Palleronia aestuarii]